MKKGRRIMALLLAFAMVLSLGSTYGIPYVHAEGEENSEVIAPEGLVKADLIWHEDDDGYDFPNLTDVGWTDDEGRNYSVYVKDSGEISVCAGYTVFLGVSDGLEVTPIEKNDLEEGKISIAYENENVEDISNIIRPYTVNDVETDDGVFELHFDKIGTYTITYTGLEDKEDAGDDYKTVSFSTVMPRAALYDGSGEFGIDNIVTASDWDNISYDPEKEYVYYAHMDFGSDFDEENNQEISRVPFKYSMDVQAYDNNIVIEDVEDDEATKKITVRAGSYEMFDLHINGSIIWNEGDDPDEPSLNIHFIPETKGLVIRWFEGDFITNPDDGYAKSYTVPLKIEENIMLGTIIDNDGETTVEPVTIDDISKITITKDGDTVDSSVASIKTANVWMQKEQEEGSEEEAEWYEGEKDGFFSLTINEPGDYALSFDSNGEESSVNINTRLFEIAAYSKDEISEDNYLGLRVDYTEDNKEFYIKAYENHDDWSYEEIAFNNVRTGNGSDTFVDWDIAEDDKTIHVVLGEEKSTDFSLVVDYSYKRFEKNEADEYVIVDENESQQVDIDFVAPDTLKDRIQWYIDGEPECGYSGRWITKKAFETGVDSEEIASYWVHADTIQGVIDKLSEVEVGENYDGYYMEDGEFKKADGKGLYNTGYIAVGPSSCGDIEMTPQYVASSGNLKGIAFGGMSNHSCFLKADDNGYYKAVTGRTGGKGDYDERGVWDSKVMLEYVLDEKNEERIKGIKDDVNFDGLIDEQDETYKNLVIDALTFFRKELTDDIQNSIRKSDVILFYDNNVYPVVKKELPNTNRDTGNFTTYYFELSSKDPIVENLPSYIYINSENREEEIDFEGFAFFMLPELIDFERFPEVEARDGVCSYVNDLEPFVPTPSFCGDIRVNEFISGLHVNAYTNMSFGADMRKLVVGYPKDTKFKTFVTEGFDVHRYEEGNGDGNRAGEWLYYAGRKVMDIDVNTSDTKTEITNPDDFVDGDELWCYGGSSYSYPITTYTIDSTTSNEGDVAGLSVVTPEPNSLEGLSYEQKDAIESGKKLTVSVDANNIDETAEIADDDKLAVEKIQTAVEATDDTRIDYMDFDVNASVEGVDEKTQITNLFVPLEITIDIPGGFVQGAEYKITRYHDGVVDTLTKQDSLRKDVGLNIGFVINEEEGTITFLADRFSVYALVREGGKTEVELTNAKWNYEKAFDYDGKEHKVELTGLPEGVEVEYENNAKTDVGKYTATFKLADEKNYKLPEEIPANAKPLEWEIVIPSETKAVIDSIAKLPDVKDVSLADEEKIKAVKAAYDKLSKEQQTLISRSELKKLTDTETALADAKKAEEQRKAEEAMPKAGETVTDEKTKATFTVTTVAKPATGTAAAVPGEVAYSGSSDSTATDVKVPANIIAADGTTYNVTAIADSAFKGNKTVKSATIESGVTTIGANAFAGCTKLTSVTIPNTVTTIGASAFESDTALKTVTFKGTVVETIGASAFKGCKKLTSITIPKSTRSIGKNAFNGCKKLKKITFKGTLVKKIGANAFKGVPKTASAKVPKKKLTDYKRLLKKAKYTGKVKK